MLEIMIKLEFDNELEVFRGGETSISIVSPSSLSPRFKNYNIETNFQIYLNENGPHFKLNHLRIMIDLDLRIRCRPDLKNELLYMFDNIFYSVAPEEEIKFFQNQNFDHYLNSLKIIANFAQLFLIEREYCYNKESNYRSPTLFFQGWIREVIDSPKEINNLCMSLCRFRPPSKKNMWTMKITKVRDINKSEKSWC
jgi:hypothetical protein